MAWNEIQDFVVERDESFELASRGVPEDDLAALEEGLGVLLPAVYRDFLKCCGVSVSGWVPFGPCWDHDFYELVEGLPTEDYPTQEIFRVAVNIDDTRISPADVFIDLRAQVDGDAPVIEFDVGAMYGDGVLDPWGLMLTEQLWTQAFSALELRPRIEQRTMIVHCKTPDEKIRAIEQAHQLFLKRGLDASFSSQGCSALCSPDTAALAVSRSHSPIVHLDLAAETKTEMGILVELVLEHVDRAKRATPTHGLEEPT